MARAAFASGARLVRYDTLDSTSSEARRRAADGERGPLWFLTAEQTAGYGRRGSEWVQRPGDVAATFLFAPGAPAEKLGQLSFVASLALADTLERFAPRMQLSLKWPNDALAGGGKIAGLLLELLGDAGDPLVALGVGVNIVNAPDAADYPTARLLDFTGAAPAPEDFVAALDAAFDVWRARWLAEGFAPVREAWLARAAGLGEKIRVRLPDVIIEGVFADLDSGGALVLDCDGERRRITAGAVLRI